MENNTCTAIHYDPKDYFIVRSAPAGVFFGHIARKEGDEVEMTDVRRVHKWAGAASLSQMATDGIKRPAESRITVVVPNAVILGVCEIIPCSDSAAQNLQAMPVWRV